MFRLAATILLFVLPFVAESETIADKFTPETPYYFESFESGLRPWQPGRHLNIEEVFKNYRYYEVVLDWGGKEISVNQYIRGVKTSGEIYLELPDGSLRMK